VIIILLLVIEVISNSNHMMLRVIWD